MQIRLAELSDAEAITRLINGAFRKAEGFLIDRDRIDLVSVRQFLQSGKFLLAEEDGAGSAESRALLGCVYVEQRGDRSYLGLLSVDPDRQKARLGSTLMSAAEEYCANAGSRFMDLQIINLREELPRFYHRLGYVETGTAPLTPNIKPKQPCHFVKMAKPLDAR
jgi:predicted N-acetyltransferase YhbS